DGVPLQSLAKPTRFANLFLVPAKADLAGAVVELARRDDGERYLAETLAGSADEYGLVFLDCPPSLGPLTVNALAAADRGLVPAQAEYYALEGLSQLLRSIELIRSRLNPRLSVAGVLLTMVDARTRLAADVEQELRRHLGPLVFSTAVPRSVRLAEAPSHGLPAIAYDRRSAGAEAYWKVAMELVERSLSGLGDRPVGPAPDSILAGRAGRSFAGRPERPARSRAGARGPHGRRRPVGADAAPRRDDPPQPAPAAEAARLRGGARARRLGALAGRHPAGRGPPPRCGRLRADRGRAAVARSEAGGAPDRARDRPRRRRARLAAPRPRRERRPGGPVAGRRGARVRAPDRRVRPLARRGLGAGRPLEAGRVQPHAAARALGRRPGDGRAGGAERGPRARGARRARPGRPPPAGPRDREDGDVGAGRGAEGPVGRSQAEASDQGRAGRPRARRTGSPRGRAPDWPARPADPGTARDPVRRRVRARRAGRGAGAVLPRLTGAAPAVHGRSWIRTTDLRLIRAAL